MGHQEDFIELAKQEVERIPRTVGILMAQTRRHTICYESAALLLATMRQDYEESQTPPTSPSEPHTSHAGPLLHVVGSEEAGSSFIDYGDGEVA
jgi:hypothetical protein